MIDAPAESALQRADCVAVAKEVMRPMFVSTGIFHVASVGRGQNIDKAGPVTSTATENPVKQKC